jgi:hypothetical protein
METNVALFISELFAVLDGFYFEKEIVESDQNLIDLVIFGF